jgi:membrane associated rhomboid family serine protease
MAAYLTLTNIIILITVLLSFQALQNRELLERFLFRPTVINDRKEYYRFLSSGFIHADWIHLGVNMYMLYLFGKFSESLFLFLFGHTGGKIAYLLFYLSAIVVSSIPSYLRHKDNYTYAALGASGATSALVFAYILYAPWQMFIFPPVPAIVFGVLYLVYSSYMDRRGGDNIGHNQHFWGAVYGLVFVIVSMAITKPGMIGRVIDGILAGPF